MDSQSEKIGHLLHHARRGDAPALGELLENYRNYLGLIARVEISPRLRAKVSNSDLVQETFKNAMQGFQEFRGNQEAELIGWLRKILAHQVAMHVRAFGTQRRDIDGDLLVAEYHGRGDGLEHFLGNLFHRLG